MAGQGRMALELCRAGDRITLGFRDGLGVRDAVKNCNPIVERIRKLADGMVPGLAVNLAIRIDGTAKTRYSYLTEKTTDCPAAHAVGNLLVLEWKGPETLPLDVMGPIYDFCDLLPGPPDGIWYDQKGAVPNGQYQLASARLTLGSTAAETEFRRKDLAGGYYADPMKLHLAVERETTEGAEGSDARMREMVREDAYFIGTWSGRGTCSSENWKQAVYRMAVRLIRHINMDKALFSISGTLAAGDSKVGELAEPDKNAAYTSTLDLLKSGGGRLGFELAGTSIHLAPAVWQLHRYYNNHLTRLSC